MTRTQALPHDAQKIIWLNAMLVVLVVSLCVTFLVINNRTASKGYQLRSAEKRIQSLQEAQKKIDELTISQQSMDAVAAQAASLGFVPVSTVDYLSAGSGSVAVR